MANLGSTARASDSGLLSHEETIELVRVVQQYFTPLKDRRSLDSIEQKQFRQGQKALTKLVQRNIRLAMAIAAKYPGMEYEDLLSEARIALVKAIESFDAGQGNRLSTMAYTVIDRDVRRAIENQALLIRIPSHRLRIKRHIGAFARKFQAANDRLPTIAEIAAEFKRNEDWVQEHMMVHQMMSLDYRSVGKDGRFLEFSDLVPDDAPAALEEAIELEEAEELRDRLRLMLQLIPEKYRIPFELRHKHDMAWESIAAQLGFTRATALRHSRQAVLQLRLLSTLSIDELRDRIARQSAAIGCADPREAVNRDRLLEVASQWAAEGRVFKLVELCRACGLNDNYFYLAGKGALKLEIKKIIAALKQRLQESIAS